MDLDPVRGDELFDMSAACAANAKVSWVGSGRTGARSPVNQLDDPVDHVTLLCVGEIRIEREAERTS